MTGLLRMRGLHGLMPASSSASVPGPSVSCTQTSGAGTEATIRTGLASGGEMHVAEFWVSEHLVMLHLVLFSRLSVCFL